MDENKLLGITVKYLLANRLSGAAALQSNIFSECLPPGTLLKQSLKVILGWRE